jgi:hypothetical protein
VFWRPIYPVVEDQCELMLAKAQESTAFPGRNTAGRACAWMAERYAAWLDPTWLQSRETQTRAAGSAALSQQARFSTHAATHSGATAVWETAHLKLTSGVSHVWGTSGQSMSNASIQGDSDAQTQSRMSARNGCHGKPPHL